MPIPANLRDPLDFKTANSVLQRSVMSAFTEMEPVEYGDYRVEVADAQMTGPTEFSKKEQKDAVLRRGEVSIPIKGRVRLVDKNTGDPVAERRTTLMRLPYLTERGTYIRPGGEYTLAFQKRLRPGVYTRKTNAGEFESFVKSKSGTGFNFVMDPDSGELYFKLYNSKTPAYAVMKAAGMDDDEIKETIGEDLFKTNYKDNYRNYYPKLWKKLTRGRKETDDPGRDLAAAFEELELDEETTTKTLGAPYRNVNKDVLKKAVGNLLQVYRGERDTDDRDSYAFQQILGPEDYVKEALLKDKDNILKHILYKAQNTKNLDHVHANLFKPVTDFIFNSSRLALTPETPNPMDALDGNLKLTGMGFGGFMSNEGVPDTSRLVKETQLGTVDLIRSPESGSVGVDSRIAMGALKGDDGKLYSKFYDINGDEQYLPSSKVDEVVVAFPGELEKVVGGSQKMVRALSHGKLDYVDPSEVEYILPSGQQMFSLGANLIPFVSGVKGMRAMMGCLHPDSLIEVHRVDGTTYRGTIENYPHRPGDTMLSVSKHGVVSFKEVRAKVPNHTPTASVKVTLSDGKSLVTTVNHKWVVSRSDTKVDTWELRADQLEEGLFVPVQGEGKEVTLQTISSIESQGVLPLSYDLDLNNHTFNSNGVYVHNSKFSITADTQVLIKRCDDSIYLGPIGNYEWQPGDMSLSLDQKNKKVDWLPVNAVSSHEHNCRIFEITTKTGRVVKATDHHSFVRADKDRWHLNLVNVYTEDLKVGDRLPVVRQTDLPEPDAYQTICFHRTVEVLDEEVAYMLGATLKSGSAGGKFTNSLGRKGLLDFEDKLTSFWNKRFILFNMFSPECDAQAATLSAIPYILSSKRSVRQAFADGVSKQLPGKVRSHVSFKSRAMAENISVILSSVGLYPLIRNTGNQFRLVIEQNGYKTSGMHGLIRRWRQSGLSLEKIASIREVDASPYKIVYDLHMDDNLFWCAAGILVHNTNQSVSLPKREAPLVQTVDGDGNSIHQLAAKKVGAIFSKQPGKVVSVSPDEMVVEYLNGTRENIELYNNYPLNRKSQLSQTPIVEPGQVFKANQPLADSNYTQNGTLALGTHLRTAYMGMRGQTHEDSMVISESAAKKLASSHMYTERLDLDDTTSTDLGKFMSIFGGTYKKNQLDNIGDNGVITPGTVVRKDDPLILNMKRRTNKGEGMISGGKASMWKDNTITWDHDYPGVVTDVWNDKKGVKLAIAADVPMQAGDKMCFTADHDIYTTNRGWVNITEISGKDTCMSLDMDTLEVSEAEVKEVHGYQCDEHVVCIDAPEIKTRVTLNHRIPASYNGLHFELCVMSELVKSDSFWVLAGPSMVPVLISTEDHVSYDKYSGWVFCPTLDKYHTLLVKCDRTVHWSGNSNIYGGKGVVGCYDDQTEILTDKGWVKFPELTDNTPVAYLEDDGSAHFTAPKAIIHAPYSGTLYGYDNECLNYLVTPNHRKWCRRESYTRKSNWTRGQARTLDCAVRRAAEEGEHILDNFDSYLQACGRKTRRAQLKTGITKNFGDFSSFKAAAVDVLRNGDALKPDFIVPPYRVREASEVHGGACLHRVAATFEGRQHRQRSFTVPYPQTEKGRRCLDTFDSVDFYAFMGWYLAEGHAHVEAFSNVGRENSSVTTYSVEIAQSSSANPEKCAEIEALLLRMGLKWTYSGGGSAYRIKNRVLCLYLKELGLSHDKYIPRQLLEEGSYTELDALLDAYMKGDGHFCNSWGMASTVSRKLADTMQEAALLAGYTSIIRGPVPRKEVNWRPRWFITFKKGRAESASYGGGYFTEEYDGHVHCVDVGKGPGVVCVRRQGKVMWSGNSVLPNDQMPRDPQGRPYELLNNPYGVVGRHNPSQIAEVLLGKIAERTGKPYLVPAFSDKDMMQFVEEELQKHGVDPEDTVTLPEGRVVDNILTGNGYFMRLHHHAESKESEVGEGAYSMTGVPTTEEGGDKPKRMGTLETDALLAYGVPDLMKEVKLIRGQENRDYFKDIMEGKNPPIPKVSPMYQKFISTLQAAGVRVTPKAQGKSLQLVAMTDADAEELSSGEITKSDTVKWKSTYNRDLRGDADLNPVAGGLFDRGITGGMGGNRWSHISMPAKLPNPVYEKQIRVMLGLTEKGLQDVIAGREKLPGFGAGPKALEKALGNLDVDKQIESLSAQYKLTEKPSVKDKLAKQIRAYKGLKNMGRSPTDLLVSKVPVIPPVFRPISVTPNFEIISDANMLYKDLLDAKDNYGQLKDIVDEDMSGEALLNVYKAHKAVTGLGQPVKRERVERNVKGLLADVFGPSGNKTGIVQRNLIGTPASYSARGVIAPDYNLTMDEIGIPEEMAWTIFKPFVVRRLIKGTTGTPQEKKQVLLDVENKTGMTRDALLKEMKERPVMYSRAPVLHKYGLLAGYAVPVPGHAIRSNIPVMAGLNADFDGNCLCGASKIVSKFPLTNVEGDSYTTDSIKKHLTKEYNMSLSGDSKIVAIDKTGVTVEMRIDEIPYFKETEKLDKNGASVFKTPNLSVWSIDPITSRVEFSDVSKFTVENVNETYLIETKSGHKVEASSNESLRVFDEETCELVKHNADTSSVGKIVAHAKVIPSYGDLHDPELGWWIGAFLSDGFFTGNSDQTDIGYVKISRDHQDRFKAAIDRLDSYRKMSEYTRSEAKEGDWGPSYKRHYWGLSYLPGIAKDCYDHSQTWEGRSCLYKKFPSIVDRLDRQSLLGLLSGLIDGDGTFSTFDVKGKKKKVTSCAFSSSSETLIDDVALLCNKLGIRYGVTSYQPTNPTSKIAYLVSMSIMDIVRNKTDLTLCGEPNERLQVLEVSDFKDDRDLVPMPEKLVAICSKKAGPIRDAKLRAVMALTKTPKKRSRGVGVTTPMVCRITANRVIRELEEWDGDGYDPDLFNKWKSIVQNEDTLWSYVTSATAKGPQKVYDLCVENGVFIVDRGLLVNDTYQVHATITKEGIEDAKEKMLPSKNLFSVSDFQLMHKPGHEFNMGLHLLGGKKKEGRMVTERTFKNVEALKAAYARGEVNLNDEVVLEELPIR